MVVSSQPIAIESLPIPILVVEGDRIVDANASLAAMVGLARGEIVAQSARAFCARVAIAEDAPWLAAIERARVERGERPPEAFWIRVRTALGDERPVCLRAAPGPQPGQLVYAWLDSDSGSSARRLTEALAWASGEFARYRDEREVLAAAADVIRWQGFEVSFTREGDDHPAFAQRRALFRQNTATDAPAPAHTPDRARAEAPSATVDAPIFVEAEPYGLLTVKGRALTPAAAATIDLFARQIGSALENVRHHERAAAQLREREVLQRELVARERLAALGEAAAVLAHEVRNPLGSILNSLSLLRRRATPESAALALDVIEEETMHLERLVRDLLQLARPLEPRDEPIDLAALVHRVVKRHQHRGVVAAPVIELTCGDAPEVLGDAQLFELVVENLVRNAVQASPPNGRVTVTLARADAGGARLAIDDEGPGITEAEAARIFEPFYTTRATGTGLGLAIVRRVVRAHGGEVSASNNASGGARFEVVLRRTAAPKRIE